MIESTSQGRLAGIDLLALCGNNEVLAHRTGLLVATIYGLAERHAGNGLSAVLLAAHGCVGLAQASETFDASTDGNYFAYAARHVDRAMRDALNRQHAAGTQPADPPNQPTNTGDPS